MISNLYFQVNFLAGLMKAPLMYSEILSFHLQIPLYARPGQPRPSSRGLWWPQPQKGGRGWQFRAVGSSKGISTPTTPLSVSRLSLFLIGQPCYLAPNLSGNGKDGAASHVFQERRQDQNQLQPNWAPTGNGGAPSATWPETEMGAPQAPRGRKRRFLTSFSRPTKQK